MSTSDGGVVATAQRLVKTPLLALGNLDFRKVGNLQTVSMWVDMSDTLGKWVQMAVTVSMAYKGLAHEITITSASGAIVHIDSKAKTGTIKLGADAKPLEISDKDPDAPSRRRLDGSCEPKDCVPMPGYEATHEVYCQDTVYLHKQGCQGGAHGCMCKGAGTEDAAGATLLSTNTDDTNDPPPDLFQSSPPSPPSPPPLAPDEPLEVSTWAL